MKKLLFFGLFFLFCSLAGFSQQQQPKSKYLVYTFTVSGLKSSADVKKLDDFLKARKGVITSTTDLQKKTTEVKVVSNLDFGIILKAVRTQGFEGSETHQTKNADQ
jgi:hypothetical protein